MNIQIGSVTINVDEARTRTYYANKSFNDCECLYCHSFAAHATKFAPYVHAFFHSLGIDDLRHIAELTPCCETEDGRYHSGGFYHLCGAIVDPVPAEPELLPIGKDFSVFITGKTPDLLPEDFPQPAVQLEIDAIFPLLPTQESMSAKLIKRRKTP